MNSIINPQKITCLVVVSSWYRHELFFFILMKGQIHEELCLSDLTPICTGASLTGSHLQSTVYSQKP